VNTRPSPNKTISILSCTNLLDRFEESICVQLSAAAGGVNDCEEEVGRKENCERESQEMSSTKRQEGPGASFVRCCISWMDIFARDWEREEGRRERKVGRSHAHDNTLLNEGHPVLRAMHIRGENRKRGK